MQLCGANFASEAIWDLSNLCLASPLAVPRPVKRLPITVAYAIKIAQVENTAGSRKNAATKSPAEFCWAPASPVLRSWG